MLLLKNKTLVTKIAQIISELIDYFLNIRQIPPSQNNPFECYSIFLMFKRHILLFILNKIIPFKFLDAQSLLLILRSKLTMRLISGLYLIYFDMVSSVKYQFMNDCRNYQIFDKEHECIG